MFDVELSPVRCDGAEAPVLAAADVAWVRQAAQWLVTPPKVSGRSAHVVLGRELATPQGPARVLRCKGIAWTNATGEVLPPSSESWFSHGRARWLACRIDPDGTVHGVLTEDRACGAMPAALVEREIAGTHRAATSGVRTSVPVLRGRYGDLSFDGRPLGFLVFAEPEIIIRLGKDIDDHDDDLMVAGPALAAVGAALRQLHRASMVNLSPHLDNFSLVQPDSLAGSWCDGADAALWPRVRVHDLDRWDDASVMTQAQVTGYRLRDLAILGWSVAGRSYRPRWQHLRHALARQVMAGYLGRDDEVGEITAVELIRFVRILRNGGTIDDLGGRWPSLVAAAVADDLLVVDPIHVRQAGLLET